MKTLAIIAEYNPLHRGHRYHFETAMKVSRATHSIVIMSGNFVQRGEAALCDKWQRAASALRMGVDLVIELPFIHAVNSAQYFAEGALHLLQQTELVDVLSFGSETADERLLKQTAEQLLQKEEKIKNTMRQGLSYAKAQEELLGESLRLPNDILGVEYLKTLKRMDWDPELVIVQRLGSYHDSTRQPFSSATAIRSAILKGELKVSYPIFDPTALEPLIMSSLLLKPLSEIYGMREGIDAAIQKRILSHPDYHCLVEAVRTPRFSLARLRRLFLYVLFDVREKEVPSMLKPNYYRILGIGKRGSDLLKKMKEKGLYLLKSPAETVIRGRQNASAELDVKSSNLYYQLQKSGHEGSRSPSL